MPAADAAPALKRRDAPVLLVMSAGIRPQTALWRASVFAERTGGQLMVAVCLPVDDRVNMLFPHRTAQEASNRLWQENTVGLRVWRWCNKNLLSPLPGNAVLVRRGELANCAASVAKRLKAHLVVLSEKDGVTGREVTTIVEDAGVTVLLSRATRPENAVIAATDMTLQGYPVVKKGAAVAELLGAPLTIVHNVEPQIAAPVMSTPDGIMFLPVVPFPDRAQLRRRRAARLESELSGVSEGETRVLEDVDTVGALLGLAKSQKADLLVVGHRRRSWLGRVFGDSVSREIVNRSIRSIMVVPVEK